ncbi:hypothetical protein Vadar_021236 [Vaccinium darrowii]|uniref:Uncharacterized protein n=1 Tax=Vaccinium darrowii TaxID=229202 RepID=A0ACB7ZCN6_9ERIC|nr:hypothetical protein Vadar_021236 [Vaccinium darrowii]
MATISSILSPNLFQPHPTKRFATQHPQLANLSVRTLNSLLHPPISTQFSVLHLGLNSKELRRVAAVAEQTSVEADPVSVAPRRLYVGNIPRSLSNDELRRIVEEHGAVEHAEVMYDKYTKKSRRFGFVTMKTVEDANAAVEKLNGTQIEGREIKVNVTEKPLLRAQFIDSPHKVYVGNLAKTVTAQMLKDFFADKGKVLSAKLSEAPGTSKSRRFGFVSFSSEEDVEAAISSLNNALLEGQEIRVTKAS